MIVASTTHKNMVDELVKIMTPTDVGASTSQAAEQENAKTVAQQDWSDNEVVSNASETGSGYGSSGDFEKD